MFEVEDYIDDGRIIHKLHKGLKGILYSLRKTKVHVT